MNTKLLALLTVSALAVSMTAHAETQRTRLTTENKFPSVDAYEGGAELRFTEGQDDREQFRGDDFNRTSLVPFLRYGFRDDVALEVELPITAFNPDSADDEFGIGDVEIGAELRAFEDIFEYPYIIPHVHAVLQTGDDDKGLGEGDNTLRLGITLGQKFGEAWGSSHGDHFTYLLDVSYAIRSDHENTITGALGFVWDLWTELAIIGEVGVSNQDPDGRNHPIQWQGGLAYDWSEDWHFALYGGGFQESTEDVQVVFKANYEF